MSGAQQDMHSFIPEEFLSPHTALVTRADPFADDLEQKYIMTYTMKATYSRRLRSDADDFYHSRWVVQVQSDLKVSQALIDKKLKSYFFRMSRAQTAPHKEDFHQSRQQKPCLRGGIEDQTEIFWDLAFQWHGGGGHPVWSSVHRDE